MTNLELAVAAGAVLLMLLALCLARSERTDRRIAELVLCMLGDAGKHITGQKLREELAVHGYKISGPRFYNIMSKLEDQGKVGCDVVVSKDSVNWTYIALGVKHESFVGGN